jgi:hypothetical protein
MQHEQGRAGDDGCDTQSNDRAARGALPSDSQLGERQA